jgi:hypothetical protein
MNNAEDNFKASIKNLEKLNLDYIQAKKPDFESRNRTIQITTPYVSSTTSPITTHSPSSIEINDYIRMCHIYCIMLWTYCYAFKLSTPTLEELRLIRNCLVHHEGDMARYSLDQKRSRDGTKLMNLTKGKSYVQGYNLIISDSHLIDFTNLVKIEFSNQTGKSFK